MQYPTQKIIRCILRICQMQLISIIQKIIKVSNEYLTQTNEQSDSPIESNDGERKRINTFISFSCLSISLIDSLFEDRNNIQC